MFRTFARSPSRGKPPCQRRTSLFFFPPQTPAGRMPWYKGCFQFRQYFHESVISAHIPEIVIHSAKRNPFNQSHACCLLHAFIKKARTDLHTLHMISFTTQSIISLLPQTCAVRHVHHEYDLFRWKCSHQSAEAFQKRYHHHFFSLSSFMARYFPETSVCEFPASSSLIAGLT